VNASRPRPRPRVGAFVAAFVLAAALLASCSSARSDLGSSEASSSCYMALPTAAKAVGGHGHLEGVRKYSLDTLRALAPRLYRHLADDLSTKQAVCLAGYGGHFSATDVEKPLGRPSGPVAVAVVTTPGNQLLGTLILTKVPVRFEQMHPF
jgi:hypothetical protein